MCEWGLQLERYLSISVNIAVLILAQEIYIQIKAFSVQSVHLSRTVIINIVHVPRDSRYEMLNQGLQYKYISLKGFLWKAGVRVGNSNSETFLLKCNGDSGPVGR